MAATSPLRRSSPPPWEITEGWEGRAPQISSSESYCLAKSYFQKITRAACTILKIMSNEGIKETMPCLAEYLLLGPNSSRGQIKCNGAMVLQIQNGIPQSFWTTFGEFKFTDLEECSDLKKSGLWKEITFRFLLQSFRLSGDQDFNLGMEIYWVRSFDRKEFPFPILKERVEFCSVHAVQFVWRNLRPQLIPKVALWNASEEMPLGEKVVCYIHNFRLSFFFNAFENDSCSIRFFSHVDPNFLEGREEGNITWIDKSNEPIKWRMRENNPCYRAVATYLVKQVRNSSVRDLILILRIHTNQWKREMEMGV